MLELDAMGAHETMKMNDIDCGFRLEIAILANS